MKFIPAIDLKDNKCVRLQKGKEKQLTIFNKDPVAQAKFFEKNGCKRIHIVDLDAAFGRPNINTKTILSIRKNINIPIELGGGIRKEDDINFWFDQGIDYIIVGSLAVKNSNMVIENANKYKDKIYIAMDILDNKIMIKGWVENSNISLVKILSIYNLSNIRGYIFTDISRDGMLEGIDMNLINNVILKTKKNIIVGGGLSNYKDLTNLKKLNSKFLEGVIAGRSLYSGNIKIKEALEIFKKNA